ncbi:MAG: hypothetical protein ACI8PZ_000810 [Myxococcota bacterium]
MSARAIPAVVPSAVAVLAVLTVVTAVWAAWVDAPVLAAGAAAFDWPRAVVVAGLYLGAHVLRIGRMLVILGDSATSVRAVAYAHALTAPVSGLIPLKLGEVARVVAFGLASEGTVHGLRAVWIERTFDAAVLAVAGLVALQVFPQGGAVFPVTVVALGVLTLTAAAITVLPENVGMAKAWLIRRYTTQWSLTALQVLDELGRGLRRSRGLVRRKVATLALLTMALWGLETAALTLLVGTVDPSTVLAGILTVLSDVLRPAQSVGGLAAQLPVHRLVVFASVNAFAALALAGLALAPSRDR